MSATANETDIFLPKEEIVYFFPRDENIILRSIGFERKKEEGHLKSGETVASVVACWPLT